MHLLRCNGVQQRGVLGVHCCTDACAHEVPHSDSHCRSDDVSNRVSNCDSHEVSHCDSHCGADDESNCESNKVPNDLTDCAAVEGADEVTDEGTDEVTNARRWLHSGSKFAVRSDERRVLRCGFLHVQIRIHVQRRWSVRLQHLHRGTDACSHEETYLIAVEFADKGANEIPDSDSHYRTDDESNSESNKVSNDLADWATVEGSDKHSHFGTHGSANCAAQCAAHLRIWLQSNGKA